MLRSLFRRRRVYPTYPASAYRCIAARVTPLDTGSKGYWVKYNGEPIRLAGVDAPFGGTEVRLYTGPDVEITIE